MEWLVFIAIYGGLFFLLYKVAKSKNRDPTGLDNWQLINFTNHNFNYITVYAKTAKTKG